MHKSIIAALALALAPMPGLTEEILPDCGLYTYRANVVRIIDSDTIVADVDLGLDVWRHDEHLRLFGINTPERGEEGYEETTKALADKMDGRKVYICTVKAARSDTELTTFGCYLATVWLDGKDVNSWMLAGGYAGPYDG